ncbi:MAG: P27 family phage terminase small subunit [Actinomycetota bacterium]|nr:P27 family phage terminase small subunit [Actinomycetota bacterium]
MASKKSAPAATSKSGSKPRETAAELAPRILDLLPARAAQAAKALGRKPSDGTVRRALLALEKTGAAERVDGVWQRCAQLPELATPDDFDTESRELHAATLKALQEQGTWRDHDIELLNDYVRRSQDARQFRAAVTEEGRFQSSQSGRIFAHPGIDKERDARRDVQTLRDALVLTPDARKKHGRDGEDESGDDFDF